MDFALSLMEELLGTPWGDRTSSGYTSVEAGHLWHLTDTEMQEFLPE